MIASTFKNKTVWITGASRGIGAALAREFSQQGAYIVLSSRSEESLVKLLKENSFKNCLIVPCDVQNENEVVKAYSDITRFKKIDILINNAGTAAFKPIWETTTEEFDANINFLKRVISEYALQLRFHFEHRMAQSGSF